ncbi:MAG: precorrin-8X methylmutase [Veillonella sp.]
MKKVLNQLSSLVSCRLCSAAESKDYLMEVSPVPYITVKGNKGGSPIAASVCNALLYTDVKRNDMLFVEGKESK